MIRTAGRSATPLDIPPLAVSPPQICGGHVLLNVMATIALWRDSARKPCDVIECSFSPRSPLAWQYVTVPIIEDRYRRVRTSRLRCSGINDELWDGTGCQAGYYFLGQSGDMALCAKRLPRANRRLMHRITLDGVPLGADSGDGWHQGLVRIWPIASFRGDAAIQSLSERSGHSASRAYKPGL